MGITKYQSMVYGTLYDGACIALSTGLDGNLIDLFLTTHLQKLFPEKRLSSSSEFHLQFPVSSKFLFTKDDLIKLADTYRPFGKGIIYVPAKDGVGGGPKYKKGFYSVVYGFNEVEFEYLVEIEKITEKEIIPTTTMGMSLSLGFEVN